jgi:2-methylcitrate dehydratase
MVAVPLLFGDLIAEHYEDSFHIGNPNIDQLRDKMVVIEEPRFTREYLESDKRSIANAIQVFFNDGSSSDKVTVEYPIGHRRRREEGIPILEAKFKRNLATRFPSAQVEKIMNLSLDQTELEQMPVHEFMQLLTIN